jgi:hypothetical protein
MPAPKHPRPKEAKFLSSTFMGDIYEDGLWLYMKQGRNFLPMMEKAKCRLKKEVS